MTSSPQSKQRIVGFDLARALAIFGMVLVNFKVAMVDGTQAQDPEWLAGIVGRFEGRAAALFVVLAGVGISLMTAKARESGDPGRLASDRQTLLKRALFLFVVGAPYTLIWPADILHFYGVYIALACLWLRASNFKLVASATAIALLVFPLHLALDYEAGWDWDALDYSGLWTPVGALRHLFFNGFHPVVPWLAFLLIGMTAGRLDWSSARLRRGVFLASATVALVTEFSSRQLVEWSSVGFDAEASELLGYVFSTEVMPPMPLYILAGASTAMAVIALSVSIGLRWGGTSWMRPLVSTGQLALSIYFAHVIVGLGILESMGKLGQQSLVFATSAALVFSASSVLFAYLWRLKFSRGPFEFAMRKLCDSGAKPKPEPVQTEGGD